MELDTTSTAEVDIFLTENFPGFNSKFTRIDTFFFY